MEFVDAQALYKEDPDKVDIPPNPVLNSLRVGDSVEVYYKGYERFWVKIEAFRNDLAEGITLIEGNGVFFERRHIFQVRFNFEPGQTVAYYVGYHTIGKLQRCLTDDEQDTDPVWHTSFGTFRARALIPVPSIPETPECDKLKKADRRYKEIKKFIAWLISENIRILEEDDQLLYSYVDVDLDMLELERRAILDYQRKIDKLFED